MTRFEPTNIRRLQQKAQIITPDSIYWDRLAKPELLKEHSTIDYIDFSPSDPDNFVLTCSVRVQIYNLVTKLVVKNLSRFQKTAYGATFRHDGRLLAAGDEDGYVKLFDTTSRNILRLFKGHTAPVHRTFFSGDNQHLTSFSDDRSVRIWNVGSEKCVQTYEDAHSDYIRAGAMHPQASNIFVSGGYDGKINLYDTRAETAITRTLDHGSPVESMLFLPNGSIFISAGGTQVRVWDLMSGCRLLTMLSQHHKTVTCLRLGSDGRRLLSGGLDRHVKIYDVSSYKTVHSLTYPNAVVSLGVAAKDQAVVAGMVDGLVSIKRMMVDSKPSHLKDIKSSYNQKHKFNTQQKLQQQHQQQQQQQHLAIDYVVQNKRFGPKLQLFDIHLRKYNYKKALDVILLKEVAAQKVKEPEFVVALIGELLQRDGLAAALTDRPETQLIDFIEFICKYLGEIRFMRTLLNAAKIVLDVFEQSVLVYSSKLVDALERLEATMNAEIKLTTDLLQLKGALDMIVASSINSIATSDSHHHHHHTSNSISTFHSKPKPQRLQPSTAAEKYHVFVE